MVGGVLFEHGHRMAATLVGCLTLVLAWSIVVRDPRPSVRALGLLAPSPSSCKVFSAA